MRIIIVGLGPGNPDLMTRQAWTVLEHASVVYLRTSAHPTLGALPLGPQYRSFDDFYDQASGFATVYDMIAEHLMEEASKGDDVVYAVPGDPLVGEATVTRLQERSNAANIAIQIVHGVSFIEPALAAIGVDGITGIQLLDATDLAAGYHPQINPDHGALIAQLYSQHIASDVKLTLMNQYPDSHQVTMIHAAGTTEQRIEAMPLYEIDRVPVAHLTTLYVPPVDQATGSVTSFEGFQETIAYLRAPDGCPWDKEQTHKSLRSYLVEESYELIDAIDSEQPDRICEELGDVLLQIVLHSQIAVDDGEFTMPEVIRGIDSKIKRRHPHVWGSVDVRGDAERVAANWEELKADERAENGQEGRGALDGVPKSLPALAQSYEYDRRAARLGFDWPSVQSVIEKIQEELAEVQGASSPQERSAEVGDLLLAISALARWLKISPEDALREANQRFYRRFTFVEQHVREMGKKLKQLSVAELDEIWNQAKRATDVQEP
jgi:tetrapyrrole methylase family protein/MazG family protein